ncbi:MAG: DUF4388 domain-containing protein [Polyangiaceae bacterium]
MSLAVVAEPDLRERVRCIRIIARQTPISALGAATWDELLQTFEDEAAVSLVLYTRSLPGAPEDAVDQLVARRTRLVLALDEAEEAPSTLGITRTTRPIPEETLVLLARSTRAPSTQPRMNFMPVDFMQMICMSGDSQILVISHDGVDTGIIEVRGGEVWTAFDSLGVGEEAFARLIRPEMRARISPTKGSIKERTLFKGLHELVLESLRRIDEGQVTLPPRLSDSQLEAALSTPEQLEGRIRQLSNDARRLLMERNYDEAARALVHLSELDPTSHLVRANLQQLRRLGYPK